MFFKRLFQNAAIREILLRLGAPGGGSNGFRQQFPTAVTETIGHVRSIAARLAILRDIWRYDLPRGVPSRGTEEDGASYKPRTRAMAC